MAVIRPVRYADVAHFRAEAKRDGAHVYEGTTAICWYAVSVDDALVGCAGILRIGQEARVRGWFVQRAHRGMGLGKLLIDHLVSEGQRMGCGRMEMKTRHWQMPERWGWTWTGKEYTGFERIDGSSYGRQYILLLGGVGVGA